ncbi:ACOT9 (predicted) [Pycnogonum litorale]
MNLNNFLCGTPKYLKFNCSLKLSNKESFCNTSFCNRIGVCFYSVDTANIKTIHDVKQKMAEYVGAQKIYSVKPRDRSHLFSVLPKSQTDLPVRKMSDSYDECLIPLSRNERVREKYVNYRGGVRFGRIMEDLDLFAVWLCYKHCSIPGQKENETSPLTIVTALVDKINLIGRYLTTKSDIKLSGKVTWTGKSSLQSTIKVEQLENDKWKQQVDACFVLVARDPNNAAPAFVNPLIAETEEEQMLLKQGEENKVRRTRMSSESLLKIPPSESERILLHELFLKTIDPNSHTFKARIKPEGSVWMEDAKLKNVIICHPQKRNIHNKVFGGFLLMQAYEQAYATALVYCKRRPYLTNVDDILFRKPVEIGSLLYLLSQVVYTDGANMQIRVHADVVNPEAGTQETTNVFHFTFRPVDNSIVSVIMPRAYHEAMLYIDGKRHLEEALGYKTME